MKPPSADIRRRPLALLALVNAEIRLGVVPVQQVTLKAPTSVKQLVIDFR